MELIDTLALDILIGIFIVDGLAFGMCMGVWLAINFSNLRP